MGVCGRLAISFRDLISMQYDQYGALTVSITYSGSVYLRGKDIDRPCQTVWKNIFSNCAFLEYCRGVKY